MPVIKKLALAAVTASLPALGYAGVCPDEHKLETPREIEKVGAKGVSVKVLEGVPLDGWRDIGDFTLRMRHFEIAPGATVSTHSHADRPAIIYFISGEIYEHSSVCAVPILHKPGESTAEIGDVQHWWSNEGDEPVVLVSADVIPR